jgi:hypothetical protein
VVIGGGLLGLEAANGLKLRGMDVTVIHLSDWLLERQLDETAGRMLQKSLEDRGLKFLLGKQTEMLVAGESGRVAAVRLKDGLELPAELVVMAVGIRPNTALAERRESIASAASWSTTPCRRSIRRSTRSANASPTAASPMASWHRFSNRARWRPTTWQLRHRPLHRLRDLDQAQGDRHRPVLGRRLLRRQGHRRDRSQRCRGPGCTRSW